MQQVRMGAVTVLVLCAAVSFGRPALADPSQSTPEQDQSQSQNQGSQDQSQSAQDQSQNQSQGAQDQGATQQNAQDRRWEQRFDRFSKALNLTEEQQEKIKPLFQSEAQQIQAVRGDKNLSRRERMAKVREIRAATQDQVKPLLTPEQLEKWGQFKEEPAGQARQHREQNTDRTQENGTWRKHSRESQPTTWQERFEQFSKNLNLTEDQKIKIQPLFEDQDEQITAVYDDTSISKTEKPEKVKAIRSATEEKIEPYLTPDQMEKWGEWKQKSWDRAQESRDRTQDQNEWRNHQRAQRGGNWTQKFDRLNKAVNLTDEQKEKIQPLFEDQDRQIQTLKHDKSMSKQARQAAIQDLHKATWAQIQSLLTPEQLEKLGVQQEKAQDRAEDRKEQSSDQTPAQKDKDDDR